MFLRHVFSAWGPKIFDISIFPASFRALWGSWTSCGTTAESGQLWPLSRLAWPARASAETKDVWRKHGSRVLGILLRVGGVISVLTCDQGLHSFALRWCWPFGSASLGEDDPLSRFHRLMNATWLDIDWNVDAASWSGGHVASPRSSTRSPRSCATWQRQGLLMHSFLPSIWSGSGWTGVLSCHHGPPP